MTNLSKTGSIVFDMKSDKNKHKLKISTAKFIIHSEIDFANVGFDRHVSSLSASEMELIAKEFDKLNLDILMNRVSKWTIEKLDKK